MWIQIWSAPGTDFTPAWLDGHLPVIRAIPRTGYDIPIVINAAHSGMDKPSDRLDANDRLAGLG